ncbi:MAG TPA: hypothetical protein VHC21_03755 [Candidatus Saccharimonadales bacterium]|nr:hypothetical protein [Candidatus Saccharimonadales bacterium]
MAKRATRQTAFANGQHDLKRGVDFIGVTCGFVCYNGQGRALAATSKAARLIK